MGNEYTKDGALLVAQVRPSKHGWAHVGAFIGNVGGYFLSAWLVMLLLPYAFGPEFAWGYWRTLAALYIVKSAVNVPNLLPGRDEVK